MTRGRLTLALVILLLVVTPLSIVAYTVLTESGLQLVARHVPKRIGRSIIDISVPRGTLAGGFEVDHVEITHERSHVIVEGMKGRVSALALLWQTVEAQDVTVRRAFVQVYRRKTPVTGAQLRFLPAGLVIRINGARVAAGTLIATNGRRFDTTNGYASGTIRQHTIKLFDTAFDWEAAHVTGSTKLTAADPMKISGAARITLTWPEQPVWTIDTTANGDLDVLPLQANFTTPMRADFQGAARDLTSAWNWSGNAQVHDFDLRAWGGGDALGRVTGTLAVHGDANGFAANGPLTPAGLAAGAFETSFKGSYEDRIVTADRIEVKHPNGTVFTGAGTIAVADNGPRLDLHGGWHDFRWPLVGKDVGVRSANGTYQLSGLWPYEWRASGPIEIPDFVPPMPAQGHGRLAKDRAYLDEMNLDVFSGHAVFAGEALWSPDERWHVKGNATGIDPSAVRKDLPGRVAFDFDAQGVGFDGKGDFGVALKNIAGKLRGVPASGGGSVARQGVAWQLDDIRLGLGGTSIQASGRIADEMNIGFSISAEDLSWLDSDAHGHLAARGRVQGNWADPVVVASIKGTDLRHGELHLASLNAAIDFDSRNTHASNVSVQARGLSHRKRTIDVLDFKLAGPASRHAIELHGTAPNLALDLRAEGSFAHGVWTGELGALEIGGSESLNLALDAPAQAVVAAQQVRIDRFCLHGAPGKVCAEADWRPEKWSAAINASELPLRTLTAGLTPEVDYRGSLTVVARASSMRGEQPQGSLRADLLDARMVHSLASGKRQSILLGSGFVTLDAGPNVIDSRVELDAGPVGTIKGQTTLARSTDRWQDMPLTGRLEVHTAELGFVTLYAPQIDRAAGKLDSEMTLTGTAGTPLVDGTIKLSDAELDQYQVNLAMRGANITARLHGNGLSYQGSAHIGDGEMQTNGELAWRDALPYGKLHLQGDHLRVANVPEAHIDASPNLDFDITGRLISVSGKVEIPYAKIEPTDLRNAVRSSADEIIVGQEAEGPTEHFEVVTDIELALSDGVSIDTSGLTGHLTGSIRVRSGQDDQTRATGELSVADGKYSAYGRKLDIERGRLIFTGGPVGNPGVDIRAIKEFPDMKAGVNVRGTLLQPRLTFFSEPSLPQSQILSLILAGGSLSQSTAGTTTTTNRQVGGGGELLAQGGALLAQQLGEKVGLEDVSVEQNLSNETSLVLGKYLSPRLYVSYGISLAESINTLKMRYSLNDHWTIRSEVGEARGADLVFTIEK